MAPREDDRWPPAGPRQKHWYPTCHMPLSINDMKVSICQAWKRDFIFLTNLTILHEVFAYTWIDSSSFILFKTTLQITVRGAFKNTNLPMPLSCIKTVILIPHCTAHRSFFQKQMGKKRKYGQVLLSVFPQLEQCLLQILYRFIHSTNITTCYF